jgi:adenine deaminase
MMQDVILAASAATVANLVLRNANVVNVFSGEIIKADIAIKNGMIAGVGEYRTAEETVDLCGKYLLPGLIDAHIHIESSLLTPSNFASVAVTHGTTAIVADPHEIVNVAGFNGLTYMFEAAKGLPVDIFYTIPSCVPATPLETSGAVFGPEDIAEAFRQYPESPALGEMMNYPGVCQTNAEVLHKIAIARRCGKQVDGHAPMLSSRDLCAYVSAGIRSDHESVSYEEALEKVRLGMQVLIREGSAAQNLLALLPAVNCRNADCFSFCSDDRHSADLINEGEMDNILRRAVSVGLDAVTAVRMATINTARHYSLNNIGAIAPGYYAG